MVKIPAQCQIKYSMPIRQGIDIFDIFWSCGPRVGLCIQEAFEFFFDIPPPPSPTCWTIQFECSSQTHLRNIYPSVFAELLLQLGFRHRRVNPINPQLLAGSTFTKPNLRNKVMSASTGMSLQTWDVPSPTLPNLLLFPIPP